MPNSAPDRSGTPTQPARHTIVQEANAETLGHMLKRARTRTAWLYCDEGEHLGGDGSAPSPMEHFVSSILF